MGLLDQVLGDMAGGSGQTANTQQPAGGSPLAGLLGGLLGGGGMGGGGLGPSGMAGGLPALLSQLEAGGLGGAVQSWIGSGANQPVSPEQLHGALGEPQVAAMAQQSGMPAHDLLSLLAQHLPGMVDAMTPNGRLPPQAPTTATGASGAGTINV